MLDEHVTRAHAGTRHISHGEHAPLAYSVSRSLFESRTPALRFSPSLFCHKFSLFYLPFFPFFLFLSHAQIHSAPIHSRQFCIFLSLYSATLSPFFVYLVVLFFSYVNSSCTNVTIIKMFENKNDIWKNVGDFNERLLNSMSFLYEDPSFMMQHALFKIIQEGSHITCSRYSLCMKWLLHICVYRIFMRTFSEDFSMV